MNLSPCVQCGHMVSPKAAACPSCGHPIAAAKKEQAKRNAGMGCGIIMLVIVGGFTWIVHEGGKLVERDKAQEAANPTCISDYTKCVDNKDSAKPQI